MVPLPQQLTKLQVLRCISLSPAQSEIRGAQALKVSCIQEVENQHDHDAETSFR